MVILKQHQTNANTPNFTIPLQDLIRELKSELSRHFEDMVLALMMTPTEYECYELRKSMKVLLFLLFVGTVQP